jgi:hypothetical protein
MGQCRQTLLVHAQTRMQVCEKRKARRVRVERRQIRKKQGDTLCEIHFWYREAKSDEPLVRRLDRSVVVASKVRMGTYHIALVLFQECLVDEFGTG